MRSTEYSRRINKSTSTAPAEPRFLAKHLRRGVVPAAGVLILAAVTGCSAIRPAPLTPQDVLGSSRDAAAAAVKDVEPLTHALSLEEALARAFKYNLDQRARMVEQAIALNIWEAGKYDMLPQAVAAAGYHGRDKDLISRSRDSVTGQPSLAHPYISSEREYSLYDLGFSWNVLDFSVGYYNAKQNADRTLIAAEHRRKAMHALSRDVTIAFWRMASAQQLRGDVKRTLAEAEAAVADAAQANNETLRSPVDNLRYQRQILENIRLLSNIDKEFATARVTLANLINLPLQTEFTVVEPEAASNIKMLDVPVERMEEIALVRNADLKEQVYNQRIAAQEVRKAMARLLPNLALNYDLRYNTDDYLINQHWSEAGLTISQNLTNLLAAPAQRRMALAGVELAQQRRIAAQMALLAQVHIARLDLAANYRQLQLADRIWNLDRDITARTANREQAQAESKLANVAAQAASIVSMLRRYQALAEFNAASGALQATLGMELELGSVTTHSLDELTQIIGRSMEAWRAGDLSAAETVSPANEG